MSGTGNGFHSSGFVGGQPCGAPPLPFAFLLRALFSFLSLAVLVTGVVVTWRWYEQNAYFTADGKLQVLLADWPLWLGLVLLLTAFVLGWLLYPLPL